MPCGSARIRLNSRCITMREVFHQILLIGNASDGRDSRALLDAGVQAVVDLALEESPAVLPREFISFRIPLRDGSGNPSDQLRLAVLQLVSLLRHEVRTLVCCSAGMSRSPAVAAHAIAEMTGQPPDKCLIELAADHPQDVSPALWNDLVAALAPNGRTEK